MSVFEKQSYTIPCTCVGWREREGKKKRVKGAKGRSLSLVAQRPEMLAVLLYQCDRGTEKGSERKTSTSTFLFLILSKQPGQANDVNSRFNKGRREEKGREAENSGCSVTVASECYKANSKHIL